MGKYRTPTPTMVKTVDEEGKVTQHRTEDKLEDVTHNKIGSRFSRADSAQICNSPLFELLGYNADTETGMHILEGTCILPTNTDPDPATGIILKEITII